jgi:quinol monooxygenase YgiN
MKSSPVIRISKGRFAPGDCEKIRHLAQASAESLVPAIRQLRGLLYYHVGVDPRTSTFVNLSVWTDLEAAKQMDTLPAMLAQRPVMESNGVEFDPIANYEPLWKISTDGTFENP